MLETFSAGYWMVPDLEMCVYPGSEAIVSTDVYYELARVAGEPLLGTVGGSHFEITPDATVPLDTVAVPDGRKYAAHDGDPLLVEKNTEYSWSMPR